MLSLFSECISSLRLRGLFRYLILVRLVVWVMGVIFRLNSLSKCNRILQEPTRDKWQETLK